MNSPHLPCRYCNRAHKNRQISCTFRSYQFQPPQLGAEFLPPRTYGIENDGLILRNEFCPSCGVRRAGAHHFGCVIERCPNCRERVIGCLCSKFTLFYLTETAIGVIGVYIDFETQKIAAVDGSGELVIESLPIEALQRFRSN